MYEGKLVRLRALKREDMITAKDYMNDSEVRKNLQGGIPFPFTLEDEYKFYEGISGMKDTYTFAIESMEKRYLGGCGINQIDWKNSVATIGIFIGDKSCWGKGYGTEAIKLLTDFIFNEMNINKVKLNVYSFNKRAMRCYEKCGFIREGVLRQEIYREGRYHDDIVMGLLRDEYKKG